MDKKDNCDLLLLLLAIVMTDIDFVQACVEYGNNCNR